MNESISRAAGASHGQEMPPEAMEEAIRAAGRAPRQRTTLYGTPPPERVAASFGAPPLAEPLNPPVDTDAAAPPGDSWSVPALPSPEDAPVARLATVDPQGRPHVVPICFVLDGDTLYTAVDEKPKRTRRAASGSRNIEANPRVEVLIDHYEDDWSRLWWVRLRGTARVVEDPRAVELLAAKYPQYAERPPAGPVIAVAIEERSEWTSSPS